jgi:hypothetical protein
MAEQKSPITFEHKGIGKALAHNRFVVPLNQREYSWEEEHVTDLLQDFSNALHKGTYFLGTIVLTTNEDGNPEVCDWTAALGYNYHSHCCHPRLLSRSVLLRMETRGKQAFLRGSARHLDA